MAVYVDNANIRYGRMRMCHMWADTLPELLTMVDKIGVSRRHLQKPPAASWVHFDVCLSKRKLAIEHGAKEMDRYAALEHVARLEGNKAKLSMIEKVRARKAQCTPMK